MRRRLPSLLLALALSAGIPVSAAASPVGMTGALEQIAAAPPSRVAELISAARKEVDESLAARARRFEDYRRAQSRRDLMARKIETMKRAAVAGPELKKALQEALILDEEAQVARSALLAAEADVARNGARLLQLYDAVLTERRQAIATVERGSQNQERLVEAYRKLAAQRDQVRAVLKPVLEIAGAEGASLSEITPSPDDDVETLLEKADLARDLEERYLRQAAEVRKRIIELEAEQALARDIIGMARTESLFDENDRRLMVERGGLLGGPQKATGAFDGASRAGGGAVAADTETTSPPPNAPTSADDGDARGNGDSDADQGDGFLGGAAEDPSASPGADPVISDVDGATDDGVVPDNNAVPDVGGSVGSPPVVSGHQGGVGDVAPLSPSEQAFLGPGPVTDADLAALLSGDAVSLESLKRIESALRKRAARIGSEEARIEKTLRAAEAEQR